MEMNMYVTVMLLKKKKETDQQHIQTEHTHRYILSSQQQRLLVWDLLCLSLLALNYATSLPVNFGSSLNSDLPVHCKNKSQNDCLEF